MSNSCVFMPSKGEDLFRSLKKQYGYKKAVDLFYIAINPQFIEDNKRTLSLDSEGVPSFESLMKTEYIQKQINMGDIISSQQKKFVEEDDTIENYNSSIDAAYNFNKTSPFNNKVVAVVEKAENGKLQVVIKEKTDFNVADFNSQYASHILNKGLSNMFEDIGISVGQLTNIEVAAGRVGVTDFSIAKSLASDFGTIIRVANNMEGAQAVSEEFSHLIVGCFIEDPSVKRSIKALSSKPELLKDILKEDYEDTIAFYDGDMEKVAEEALGHILQDCLLNNINSDNPAIINRAAKNITSKFKHYDLQELQDIIADAEAAMNDLAKGVLNGSKKITREDIVNNRREMQLNALSNTVDRNIDILKTALRIEQKRFTITDANNKTATEDVLNEIKTYLIPGADTVMGILSYAQGAIMTLKDLQSQFSVIETLPIQPKFNLLRKTKTYIESYGQFINTLNDAISKDLTSSNITPLLSEYEIDGNKISCRDCVRELNDLSKLIEATYYKLSKSTFTEFIKPFIGESITIETGNNAGTTISVEELVNTANSDISFFDRWLDSMGNSSDVLLQAFDAVVKKTKDKVREDTIINIQSIQHLRMEAESLGITSFSFMFERDDEGNKTGNYISEINYGQYKKDLDNFIKELNDKYGENPTGEDAKKKLQELKDWHKIHSRTTFGKLEPNETYYANKEYDDLNDNQKKILREFRSMKRYFDGKLPKNKVDLVKAIQIRKTGGQRILDSLANPSTIFSNIKESVASSILEREDDDTIFGNRRTSLTDFNGREFMTLPVLYTNRLEDPNELSEDVFATLMSYAYMANNYEQMDKIIDALETGRNIVENQRKVITTRGGEVLMEKFTIKGEPVSNLIYARQSNIVARLNDFFESQVYNRYLKDQGTFDVFGHKVNTQKLASEVLKKSSFVQLGFNFLANLANVTTGVAMQNIEAACGQYFNAGELVKADVAYISAMKDYMAELCDRNKKSKLALFDQLFNIKQDFDINPARVQSKKWFERIFGSHWAFIGQSSGDHWLYNRTAIAMAKRKQVIVNGKQMSLWDALEVRNRFSDNDEIKELNYREIKELDGSNLDIHKFSRQVAKINHRLFGIYNKEDENACNRLAMGRLLMQYRKWIKPQMNVRFQKGQYDITFGEWEEGYYRTVLRLGNDLLRGKVQLGECWGSMKDFEKKNVIRAFTEIMQFMVIWGVANWLTWPNDKKRPWALKLAEYSVKRLAHETGGLTPSTVMIQEQLKTIRDPIAAIGLVSDALNLFNSCISPEDWTDEISSGPYKGCSTLEKNIIKSPLPGIASYRMVNKFIGDLDNSINYYVRPSY